MKSQRGSVLVLYLVLALGALGTIATIGFKVRHDGYTDGFNVAEKSCRDAAQAQREKESKQITGADEEREKADAKAKVVYRTITKTVDRYIDRPVYRNVCLDADGLRDANAAILGALTPASESDKPLPDAKPAGQRDGSEGAAQAN